MSEIHSSSSPGPLYAPRNPILRLLLVALVAAFVIFHEVYAWLVKSRFAAGPLPEDGLQTSLARSTTPRR